MLRILTPIVPQSSDDASLTRTDTLPDCGVDVVLDAEDVPEEDPPPPHAATAIVRPEARTARTACPNLLICISVSCVAVSLSDVCQKRGPRLFVDRGIDKSSTKSSYVRTQFERRFSVGRRSETRVAFRRQESTQDVNACPFGALSALFAPFGTRSGGERAAFPGIGGHVLPVQADRGRQSYTRAVTIESETLLRLGVALPRVREWIDEFVIAHAPQARPVSSFGWPRLARIYPPELLDRAKAVTLDEVPFPPVGSFGLPELETMQPEEPGAITFKDTFFVRRDAHSESLHFHELVHVVQWDRLGVDNFLLAYGVGLAQFGYRNSPLEQMAYDLEERFDRQVLQPALVTLVQRQTDSIWKEVQRTLKGYQPR
jgi:hypothetical protein